MRRHLPVSFYNTTTFVGVALAAISLSLIVFLFLVELFSRQQHPYMGIITFMVMPVFLIFGLILIFWGIWRVHRRARAGKTEGSLPHIDLNNPRHRNAVLLFMVGSFMFLVMSAFGSYQAYEYTDSVEFCGLVCHNVMKPEYTAYLVSPHARVACVQCHIGPGADWFVRSKISGTYQVYSVLFHKYHRPIQTPIANLRPARETCEQCHWPRQFYSAKLQGETYYLSDEKNTRSQVNLLMKIGGGDPKHGQTQGIHFHMYLNRQISYVATDRLRNDIPYIEAKAPDGSVVVYRSTENPMTDAQVKSAKKHLVDCIECHNRPTHIFRHPAQSVNLSMSLGRISPDLPEIKRVSVEELEKPYKTEPEALSSLRRAITAFYREKYPQIAAAKSAEIEAAVREIQQIYSHNFFPEMRVSWKAFPDHIGHMYSPGCFRCHDNKHVGSNGKVLNNNCNTCHTILSQRFENGPVQTSLDGLKFRHPVDIGDSWKEMKCSDCHAPQQ
jgi:hypothetical protein